MFKIWFCERKLVLLGYKRLIMANNRIITLPNGKFQIQEKILFWWRPLKILGYNLSLFDKKETAEYFLYQYVKLRRGEI